MDNRALKKLLIHMDEKEFNKIFKAVDLKQISIQGFERKKNLTDIPKPLIINSLFQQQKRQFKVLEYMYDYYKNHSEYRFSKFDSKREPEAIINDITSENENLSLVWLLSQENETYRKAACDYINSVDATEKSNDKNSLSEKVEKLCQIDQNDAIQTEINLEKRIKEVDELKSKMRRLELKNNELVKKIESIKENNSDLNQKLKKSEAQITILNNDIAKKDESIELLSQKYTSLLTDYEKNLIEMNKKEETQESRTGFSKKIVITNQQYEENLCKEGLFICRQDELEKILEEWDQITDIYVSDCCISEGNRRKLMKKRKNYEKNIQFLSEKMISNMISGGC